MCLRKKHILKKLEQASECLHFGSELLTGICEMLFLRCSISRVYLLQHAFPLPLELGYRNRHSLPLFLPLVSRRYRLLLWKHRCEASDEPLLEGLFYRLTD